MRVPKLASPASEPAREPASKPIRIVARAGVRALLSDDVIKAASDFFGLSPSQLFTHQRTKPETDRRFAVILALSHFCPFMTLTAIGRMIGDRDHSTIFHAVKVMKAAVECRNERGILAIRLAEFIRARICAETIENEDRKWLEL